MAGANLSCLLSGFQNFGRLRIQHALVLPSPLLGPDPPIPPPFPCPCAAWGGSYLLRNVFPLVLELVGWCRSSCQHSCLLGCQNMVYGMFATAYASVAVTTPALLLVRIMLLVDENIVTF